MNGRKKVGKKKKTRRNEKKRTARREKKKNGLEKIIRPKTHQKLHNKINKKRIVHLLKRGKRASRTKSTVPKSPEGWAETVHLILKSATPRRASLLKNHEASVSMDPLELRKVGRPKRQLCDAKRRPFLY